MKFFVFVDMEYYPYVDDPVEAESLEEARRLVAERLSPARDVVVFLAPMEAVTKVGPMEGPREEPKGLLKLMEESNRLREQQMGAMRVALGGEYEIRVEPGSHRGSIDPENGSAA